MHTYLNLAGESITVDMFRRKSRVMRASDLPKAHRFPVSELELPINSVFHYLGEDINDNGPSGNDPFIVKQKKNVNVKHILDYVTTRDIRLKTSLNFKSLISDYHRKNKKTRLLVNEAKIPNDQNTLVVYNYGLLDLKLIDVRSVSYWYDTWAALIETLIHHVVDLANNTGRQQFIRIDMPDKMLTVAQLNNPALFGSNQVKPNKEPSERNNIFIYKLWQWLLKPTDSIFSPLNKLAESSLLNKVDLVFVDKGYYVSLNLGMLFNSRLPTKEEASANPVWSVWLKEPRRLSPTQLTRLFYIFLAISKGYDTPEKIIDEEDDDVVISDDEHDGLSKAELAKEEKEFEKRISTVDKIIEMSQQTGSTEVVGTGSIKAMINAPVPDFIEEIKTKAAQEGSITAAELRKIDKLIAKSKEIKAPNGQPIHEFIKRNPEEEKLHEYNIPDKKIVFDKTALKSTLININKDYINKRLMKDICEVVMSFTDTGVIVTNLEISETKTLTETSYQLTIQLGEIGGATSTVHLKIQGVQPDGTFLSSGTKYQMRPQLCEDPIRKIDSTEVMLTSYYGKTSITRNQKRVNDLPTWITNKIIAEALDDNNTSISELKATEAFNNGIKTPRIHGILSKRITTIRVNDHHFNFNYTEILKDPEVKKAQEKISLEMNGAIICGHTKGGLLVVDNNNTFYAYDGKTFNSIGDVYEVFKLDQSSAPIEYAEINIYSKAVPVGVFLAYKMTLSKLLNELGVKYRIDYTGSKPAIDSTEYALRFNDCSLIFDRTDTEAMLIIGGFNEFRDSIAKYSLAEFDSPDIYYNVLESKYISAKHLDGINDQWLRFIDPITKNKLIELNEPITYRGLLLRSVELLATEEYPDKTSVENSRLRCYERIPGHLYTVMSKAIKKQIKRNGKKAVDIPPYAVWQYIATDPTVIIANEINPLEHVRNMGMITFSGHGGRNERTMVGETRAYHESAEGLMSEGTTDAGNVGVNCIMPLNPKIKTIYGTIGKERPSKEKNITGIFTANALCSPGIWHDDSKRVTFKQIHDAHTRPCAAYVPYAWRTGTESVVADYCNSSKFAITAKKPGKVTKRTDEYITVEYDDGTTETHKYGLQFGTSAGTIIPMPTVCEVKEGEKFKIGKPLIYNTDFFEKDPFDVDGGLCLKFGIPVIVRFVDNRSTIEDSTAISKQLAEKMSIDVTHKRVVVVKFTDEIYDLVKVGAWVHQEDSLCKLLDSSAAALVSNIDEVEDTLDALDRKTPRAKYAGRIDKIDIYYHGEKEEMSSSLRKYVTQSDANLAKSTPDGKAINGDVKDNYRVDGKQLLPNTAAIIVHITDNEPMGSSDKLVFGTQLKSTVTRVMTEVVTTEDGHYVDATFGTKSLENRLVYGVYLQLTLNMVLWYLTKAFISEVLGE